MEVIEHPVEKLRAALISSRRDLVERYWQYSKEERKVLEDCLRPDGVLFRPISVLSDSDWNRARAEGSQDFQSFFSNPYRSSPSKGHHTIYIQTIGESSASLYISISLSLSLSDSLTHKHTNTQTHTHTCFRSHAVSLLHAHTQGRNPRGAQGSP